MIIYSIVFLVISLCSMICYTQIPKKLESILYWGCAGSLGLLSAIRDFSVGADTLVYCQGYQDIRQLSLKQIFSFRWEKGYVLINWVLGKLFSNERALLVFMSCFILIPIFFMIKKESKYPLLSLIVFIGMGMWTSSMFILRQWCAITILTFSYKYIKSQRLIPFLISVLIASLFHRTAIIFLLAYFIFNIHFDSVKILLCIPVSILVGLLGRKILNILNHFARISEAGNFNGGVSILIVFWLCIIALLFCFKGKIPTNLNFEFRSVFLAAVLQPIAFTFSNWARVIMYFSIMLTIFLPNFVFELTHIKNGRFKIPIGICMCMMMFIWFKHTGVQPYMFMN